MKAIFALFLSLITPAVHAFETKAPKSVGAEGLSHASALVPSLPLSAALNLAIPPQAPLEEKIAAETRVAPPNPGPNGPGKRATGAKAVLGRLLNLLYGPGNERSPAPQSQPGSPAKPEAARQRLDLMFEGGTLVTGSKLDGPEGTTHVLGYNAGAERVLYHSRRAGDRIVEQFWKVEGGEIRLAEQRVLSKDPGGGDYGSMQVSRFEKRPTGRPHISIDVMKWKPVREGYGGFYPSGAIDDGMIAYYPDKANPLTVYSDSTYGLTHPMSLSSHASVKTYFEGKVVLNQETSTRSDNRGRSVQKKVTDGNGHELSSTQVQPAP